MQLQRDSRLVKWAFSTSSYPPRQTSLCVLFWRAVVLVPLIWLLIGLLFPVWIGPWLWDRYCDEPFREWQRRRRSAKHEQYLAERDAHWQRMREEEQGIRKPPDPSAWTVLWLGFKAIKGKVCPLVKLK